MSQALAKEHHPQSPGVISLGALQAEELLSAAVRDHNARVKGGMMRATALTAEERAAIARLGDLTKAANRQKNA